MSNLEPKRATINIADMREDPENANRMDEDRLHTLAAAIERFGFQQPVLLRHTTEGRVDVYHIIDGHHRRRAAIAAGLDKLPAVIVECTDSQARMLQLGMNRLRGEVDLTLAARNIAELTNAGVGADDLVLTGFSVQELEALLAAGVPDHAGGDPLAGGTITGSGGAGGAGGDIDETFTLTLEFGVKGDLARAKRALKRAANGGELSAGLLALIDTAQASGKKGN